MSLWVFLIELLFGCKTAAVWSVESMQGCMVLALRDLTILHRFFGWSALGVFILSICFTIIGVEGADKDEFPSVYTAIALTLWLFSFIEMWSLNFLSNWTKASQSLLTALALAIVITFSVEIPISIVRVIIDHIRKSKKQLAEG